MGTDYKFYVVYHGVSDYPKDYYIVRGWQFFSNTTHAIADEKPLYAGDSLEEARAAINRLSFQYLKFPPMNGDDPVIKELWL
jgi:hypothetical protein